MPTLSRLPHWAAILWAIQAPHHRGSHLLGLMLVAFLPPLTAWTREELGAVGVSGRGPSRHQRYASATIETVAGVGAALSSSAGLLGMLLLPIGAGWLLLCWGLDLGSMRSVSRVELEFDGDLIRVRRGSESASYLGPDITVRRLGPTFFLSRGGKTLEARFGSARAAEIEDELRRRGVAITVEPFVGWGPIVPFLAAAGCTLFYALVMGKS